MKISNSNFIDVDFVPNGNVQFFNQNLPQKEEAISKDAVEIIRNEVRVGLGTTLLKYWIRTRCHN